MSIDKSGAYWVGSESGDIETYLRALTIAGYRADRFVHARCTCGCECFALNADQDEGCAQRVCSECKTEHLICDSEDSWSAAEPEPVKCPCGSILFEVAVGFSLREDKAVRWVAVGERCVKCGVLGSAVDWKIDYAPTEHLYDRV